MRQPLNAGVASAVAALLLVVIVVGTAFAQTLPEPAAEALRRGQLAAADALANYTDHQPDDPLWSDALSAGTEAARLAPDHPAPRRFLAQAYLQVGWYARSWSAWQAYLDRGGNVDASAERQLVQVARWMGLNAYDAGRRDQAVPYLETVVRYRPDDLGANERLARLYLERGEPRSALPYLEALDGRFPALSAELTTARRIDRYGRPAADAYAAAIEARDSGALQVALEQFLEATTLRPDFTDAWRGAAAAAERLGRPNEAESAYRQVLTLAPNDAEALAGLGRIALAAEERTAQAENEAAARAREAAEQAAEQAAAQARAEAAEAAARAAEERAAEERAAEEVRARQEAEAAAAEAAAAAEQEAAAAAAAEAAEQEAARAAAEQAAEAAAEAEAQSMVEPSEPDRAQADETAVAPMLLVDAVAEHRRSSTGPSPSVAFVRTPELDADLGGHTDGVIHLRLEVLDKPSDAPVLYQMCLVPSDITVRPACTNPDRLAFSETGTFVAEQRWSDLTGFGSVDWRAGVDSVMLVLRRPDGSPIGADRTGNDPGDDGLDAYLPTTIRVQALVVPAGVPFPGWP